MKQIKQILAISGIAAILFSSCKTAITTICGDIREQNIDNGWKFCKDSTIKAEGADYDDSKWRTLDLPHDWSIEDLPGEQSDTLAGPFSKSSIGTTATGYTVGGTAWYRRHFIMDASAAGKKVFVSFDGVYMESDVWVNGKHAGFHPYGYTPFYYDITQYLNAPGKENVIAVKVQNNGKNSRWYSGSGIYRHVQLIVTNPVHIDMWGLSVTTPLVTKDTAIVTLRMKVRNTTAHKVMCMIRTQVMEQDGKILTMSAKPQVFVEAGSDTTIEMDAEIESPSLWSCTSPTLYKAMATIITDTVISDEYTTSFGIRSIAYSAEKGFLLNGESIELKGSCMHHDNGMLGSATYDKAEERRISIMKDNGYNAIRTSHNPPSQQFLDVCDRLGMLVIDEAFDMWERPKNPNDYHRFFKEWYRRDLESMLLRDRNHPSVVFWSIGNEINERGDTSGYRIAQELIKVIHEYDTTRPITNAICGFWDHPGNGWEKTETAFSFLDVGGYNYQCQEYLNDHKKFPKRLMMGTESFPMEAYKNWKLVEQCPWVIGDFVWTGMDYLGETGLGNAEYGGPDDKVSWSKPWPWVNAWCGDIDICGNKKPQSYFRDVIWGNSKIEMAVHEPIPAGKREIVSMWGWPNELQSWNWKGQEGKMMNVNVYSACTAVRLELNGKVIGEKKVIADSNLTVTFQVPYEPGELKAIGLNEGKEAAKKIIATTGRATNVKMHTEQGVISSNRNDLAYFAIEITDENGNVVPDEDAPVEVKLAGEGELLAFGNACPNKPCSYRQSKSNTFRGRALLIVRPTGKPGVITVTVSAPGLGYSFKEIQVK